MQVCLTFPHGWVQVLPPRVTAVSDAVSFSTRRIRRQAGPFCSLSLRLILIPHNAPCFGQGLVTVFPLSTNMGGTGRLSETAPVSCSSSCSPLGSASVGDARPPAAYWRGVGEQLSLHPALSVFLTGRALRVGQRTRLRKCLLLSGGRGSFPGWWERLDRGALVLEKPQERLETKNGIRARETRSIQREKREKMQLQKTPRSLESLGTVLREPGHNAGKGEAGWGAGGPRPISTSF